MAGLFVLGFTVSGWGKPSDVPGGPPRTSNELELGLGVERSVSRAPVAPVARITWLHRAGGFVSLGALFEGAYRPSPDDGFADPRPALKLAPALRLHSADAPVSAYFQTALGRAIYRYPSRHDGCSHEDLLFLHFSAGGRARVFRSTSVGGSATLAVEGAVAQCSFSPAYNPTQGPTDQGNPPPGTPRVVLLAHVTAHF